MERPTLPSLPAGYSSQWLEDRLEIIHAWRRGWGGALLALWLIPAALTIAIGGEAGAVLVGYFSLMYGGIFLPYIGLSYLLNKTKFSMHSGGLEYRHGPIPLKRGGMIERSEIVALHTEDHGTGERSWYVGVELKSGKRIYIVEGAKDYDSAKRIERVIEEQLGIHPEAGSTPSASVAAGDHAAGAAQKEEGAPVRVPNATETAAEDAAVTVDAAVGVPR